MEQTANSAKTNRGVRGKSGLQAWQKMAEKSDGFPWSQKSRLAAELVAEDRLTDAEIAAKVGIGARTLYRWKSHPSFSAEVEKHVEDFNKVVRSRGIARLERRVAALNDRWNRMLRIIEARADDPAMADVPGGKTGLLVRSVKGVGRGKDFQLIERYTVDLGLLRMLLMIEKQAAQELGQWGGKIDPTSKGGHDPIEFEIVYTEGGRSTKVSGSP